MIRRARLAIGVAGLVAVSASLWAQNGRERTFCEGDEKCSENTLRITFGDASEPGADPATFRSGANPAPGEEFAVTVLSDVQEEVQGWSVGVAHDPSRIELVSVTLEGLGLPEIFFETTVPAIPRPGSPGFVSAVVLQIVPSPGVILATGDNTPLVTARYKLLSAGTAPALIEFSHDLVPNEGSPPTPTNLTIAASTKSPRTVIDGTVGETDGVAAFSRGDVNGDGAVNLVDAAIAARNIFLAELVSFRCDDMLDANDDGQLGITDPVAIIAWLFLRGEPLAEPFRACGFDDDNDLGCEQPNCEL